MANCPKISEAFLQMVSFPFFVQLPQNRIVKLIVILTGKFPFRLRKDWKMNEPFFEFLLKILENLRENFFFSFNSEKTSAKKISNKLSENYELQTFVFIRIFNLNNCQNVAFQTFLQLSSLKALITRNKFSDSIKYYQC